jgi:hypothetical protein
MSYIVCGWYTPDYAHWASPLKSDLEKLRCPYDFVEVPGISDHWEHITLRKAAEVQAAMGRHPDKVVVFLDVDCLVRSGLSPLVDLSADVAVYMHGRRRANGGYKMHAITRTIVFKPTEGARSFVANWRELSERAQYGDVDQTAFLLAMGQSTGTSFQPLERKWSAVETDNLPDAVVIHDSASKHISKISNLRRRFTQITGIGKAA